jgi:NAD(P)H-dependent FMN reductase
VVPLALSVTPIKNSGCLVHPCDQTLRPGPARLSDQGVADAVAAVRSVDLLVIASPRFKATYTGLLKLFLDQVPRGASAVSSQCR